jgi:hypothetical protein
MKHTGRLLFFCFLLMTTAVSGQESPADSTWVKQMESLLEYRNYIFQVQSMVHQRGGMISQSPGYNVVIKTDTIISVLPYVGRAYTAGYSTSSDGGLRFTSKKFSYKKEYKAKKGWTVTIFPKDARSVSRMIIRVFEGGRATLSVICSDREGISYNGYVQPSMRR